MGAQRLSDLNRPVVYLAREYATKGLTLKRLAVDFRVNYSGLKGALRLRGYQHPVGIALVQAHIKHETGWNLPDYVSTMIAEGLSRNTIAHELEIDNKTLQAFADRCGLTFPAASPTPKDFTNIIAAIRLRTPDRTDLRFIEHDGQRRYIAEWSNVTGISRSTIIKRLQLGWAESDAVSIPVNSKRKSPCRPLIRPNSSHPWRESFTAPLLNCG